MARERVFLICENCLSRNYQAMRRKDDPTRLAIKKFCPRCGTHTLHKESK